jgi:exopolysaccharide biosynthesis polyprenyl glycosylphosphotransferase
VQTVSIQRPVISEWGRFAKSVADYVISAVVVVVVLPPVFFLVALAIKLDSPGPVLFRQHRQGLNGRVFTVFKFRTMTVQEDGPVVKQASRHDRRVTRVGRVLRRSSLDELPQFFNVLKGDMSIVGPRPHAVAHDTYYGNLLENYANRYRVKPGITGWAQVNGFRGELNETNNMQGRVEYDLQYINNWTFWFDIFIMLITPFCSFFSRRAY